ncbi:hypothetical protein [Novosphingobium sp. P6W]|nr:hypothetical protein [Novosphingobium sp. P6W]
MLIATEVVVAQAGIPERRQLSGVLILIVARQLAYQLFKGQSVM